MVSEKDIFSHRLSGTGTAGKVPANEQEQQIHKFIIENGVITTAQTAALLGVKSHRAREILNEMVRKSWLKKEGASRNTAYVINIEK